MDGAYEKSRAIDSSSWPRTEIGASWAVAKALVVLTLLCTASANGKFVSTEEGTLRGTTHRVLHTNVNEFLGVPYARAPVGSLRFSKPVASRELTRPYYNATSKPNACWQPIDTAFGDFVGSTMWNPNTNMSEDCLYLNVWAPEAKSGTKLPVMVWIYGGGFYGGSSALDVYDGSHLAALGNVVVVSMNYRVGILGFLHLPNSTDAPGNAGLWDQVEALRWVRRNIDKFGGDKDSVTLFGESAGAASVAYHLISPVSRDLFQRAILQSGSALSNWAFMTPENALLRNELVLKSTGCDVAAGQSQDQSVSSSSSRRALACLRSETALSLTEKQWFTGDMLQFPYLPTVDGELLREHPMTSMLSGRFKKCPILIGSTKDEGGFYVAYLPEFAASFNATEVSHAVDADEMRRLVSKVFRSYPQWPQNAPASDVDLIACRYASADKPDSAATDNVRGLIAAVGDSRFLCSVNEWASHYAASNSPAYYYLFDHASAAKPWGAWTGSMHGDEMDYVFGSPFRSRGYTDDDRRLSGHVIRLWATFARTGIPMDGNVTQWPRYANDDMAYYELSLKSMTTPTWGRGPRDSACAFLRDCLSSSPNARGNTETAQVCQCQVKRGDRPPAGAASSLDHPLLLLPLATIAMAYSSHILAIFQQAI